VCRVAAHLHKVEPLSSFEAHGAHEAHNAGRSSTAVYIENEWTLAASAAPDAFGVSARLDRKQDPRWDEM